MPGRRRPDLCAYSIVIVARVIVVYKGTVKFTLCLHNRVDDETLKLSHTMRLAVECW